MPLAVFPEELPSQVDPQPDIAGFATAQRRLRQSFGRDVRFFSPTAATYDPALPSAAFDPETGMPYDPAIQPVSSAYAVASALVNVASRSSTNPAQADALGLRSNTRRMLIVDRDDYELVRTAEFFELDGKRYKVELVEPDGIGDLQRYLVYGEAA